MASSPDTNLCLLQGLVNWILHWDFFSSIVLRLNCPPPTPLPGLTKPLCFRCFVHTNVLLKKKLCGVDKLPLTCCCSLSSLFRGEGVDGVGTQQPGSGDGAGLRHAPATCHQVQLQRLGRAAPCHCIGLRAVPAGSGLQLQEVPSL